tara:strand:- start:481 stop:819 length:339 start_codon:yes stop_codon:yes gene_type:complete
MSTLTEGKLVSNVLDLSKMKNNALNEMMLAHMGDMIKSILGAMFTGSSLPVHVKGTSAEIAAFVEVLGRERRYIEAYMKHGLSDAKTYQSKYQLQNSIRKFESETGIKWPFS